MCCAVSPVLRCALLPCLLCLFVCLSVCLFVLVLFYFLLFGFVFVTPTGGTEWKEAELAGSIRECGKSFWHTHLIRHREVLHIGFSFLIGTMHGHQALCSGQVQTDVPLDAAHAMKPMQTAFQETCVSVEHCGSSFDDQEAATSKSEQCQDFGLCSFGGDGCTHHSPNTMPKQEQLTHSPGQLSTFVCPARSEAVRRWDIICDMIWYDMIWYQKVWYDMICIYIYMYPFSKTGFGLLLCSAVCLGSVSFFFFSSCFLPTSRLVTFVRVSFALFFSFRFSPALGPSVISRLFSVSSDWCSLCPTQVRSCRRASHVATILAVRVRIPFGGD